MDATWTVYVRDIFIILAAAALILACTYLALVGWQIYRMAQSLSVELEPILSSVQQSAKTVENTTGFVSGRMTSPVMGATNTAAGLFGLFQLYRRAKDDQRATEAATATPVSPAAGSTVTPAAASGPDEAAG
jgi:hypothetical protein